MPTPRTDRGRAHAQRRTCAHTHPPTHTRSHAPAQPRTREATHTRTDAATHIRSHAQTQPRTRAHTCERMADIGIGIGTAPAAGGSQARRTRGVPCGLASSPFTLSGARRRRRLRGVTETCMRCRCALSCARRLLAVACCRLRTAGYSSSAARSWLRAACCTSSQCIDAVRLSHFVWCALCIP